jgi:GGDEF domain-containing protein
VEGETDYIRIVAEAHARMGEIAEQTVAAAGPDREAALLQDMESLAGAAREIAAHGEASKPPQRVAPPARVGAAASSGAAVPGSPARTELHTDPGLLGRVGTAVAACRQKRCSVTLLLAQVDDYEELILTRGLEGAQQAARLIEASVDGMWDGAGACLAQGDGCYALIMEDCDRPQGVELARRMVHGMRDGSRQRGEQPMAQITVSAGLATLVLPPKNFPPQELIESAQRCLSAAQLSGGDVVKSIDIY